MILTSFQDQLLVFSSFSFYLAQAVWNMYNCGKILGFDRETAAKFSLLLSIPAILGATVLEAYDLVKLNDYELNLNLLTATTLSFAFSLASINFMMSWIKKYSFTPFIIYRLLLGIILLLAIYFW